MGFTDLFRPKWKHSDPEVRAEAVRQLGDDQAALLATIAKSDADARVRRIALKRIDDHTFEQTGKIKGVAVETSTFKVSPDGKTLTVTAKGKIPQERGPAAEYSNTQVFERDR